MSYFDSLTHSMTTIATGGFSNYNESIGYFNNVLIELNAIIFIILGSIPFIAYIKYLNGDKKVFYICDKRNTSQNYKNNSINFNQRTIKIANRLIVI